MNKIIKLPTYYALKTNKVYKIPLSSITHLLKPHCYRLAIDMSTLPHKFVILLWSVDIENNRANTTIYDSSCIGDIQVNTD